MSADYVKSIYFCDFCRTGFDTLDMRNQHCHIGPYRPPSVLRGCFIDFIGARKSGKTRQMDMLQKRLEARNIESRIYMFSSLFTKSNPTIDLHDMDAAFKLFCERRLEFDKEIRWTLSMGISIISDNYSVYCVSDIFNSDNIYKDQYLEFEEKLLKPDMSFFMKSSNSTEGVEYEIYTEVEKIIKPKSFDQFIELSKWYSSGDKFRNPGLCNFVGSKKGLNPHNYLTIISPVRDYTQWSRPDNWIDYLISDTNTYFDYAYLGETIVFNYRMCCSISVVGIDDVHIRILAPVFFYLYNSGVWNSLISKRELESVLDPLIKHHNLGFGVEWDRLNKARLDLVSRGCELLDCDRMVCGLCFDAKCSIVLWKCSHTFCENCSIEWLNQNASTSSCPKCCDQPKNDQSSGEKVGCEQLRCGICFEVNRDIVAWNCSHIFCKRCSSKWINQNASNPTCPICRTAYAYYIKLTLN